MGVPQLLLNPCAVDGGKNVHNVVGAVPVIVVAPTAGAVPPEMLVVDPTVVFDGWNQVVIKVNTVAEDEAWVRIYSPVYGEVALVSWKRLARVPVN